MERIITAILNLFRTVSWLQMFKLYSIRQMVFHSSEIERFWSSPSLNCQRESVFNYFLLLLSHKTKCPFHAPQHMAVFGSVTLMSGPEGILLPVAQLSCGHRLWKENISDCFNTFNSFLLFLCREKFLSLSQDVLQRCDVSRFFLSDASVLPCSHCENPSDWPIRKGYQLMTNVKVTKYQ